MKETPAATTAPVQPRMDLSRPFDVAYWTAILGCSATDLRRAVEAVGTGVDDVRRHFLH